MWIKFEDIKEVLQPILRSWYQIKDRNLEYLMQELEKRLYTEKIVDRVLIFSFPLTKKN